MHKKTPILTVMVLTVLIGFPVDGLGTSMPMTKREITSGSIPEASAAATQPRRRRGRRAGYWRNGRWYRNYGQYRRHRPGYRRYRIVRRYYWDHGIRRVRYIRVYY